MRKAISLLGALLLACGPAWAQMRKEPLGDVARRVRAARARKDLSRVPLYTNDNLPRAGEISIVGSLSPSLRAAGEAARESEGATATRQAGGCDEQCWRGKFQAQHEKIRTAERELDILQREYNLTRTQFYQDPNQAMREQYSGNVAGGRQLMELQQKINEKQAELSRLQRELSQLENELRRAGGNPGWARQ